MYTASHIALPLLIRILINQSGVTFGYGVLVVMVIIVQLQYSEDVGTSLRKGSDIAACNLNTVANIYALHNYIKSFPCVLN